MKLSGWGLTSRSDSQLISISDSASLLGAANKFGSITPAIPHGNGRSYGDQALAENVWSSRRLDHLVDFDEATGEVTVEAGVTLGELQSIFIPQGWALPVTPGTQFVTVGGAIANDVHGKNHHRFGTFGEHVRAINLLRTDGASHKLTKRSNRELFEATIGGLGLTGFITSATIQLKKIANGWIDAEVIPFASLDEFWSLTAESADYEYTVSWLDIKKKSVRGIFNRGNDSQDVHPRKLPTGRSVSVPFTPPIGFINRATVGLLAEGYYRLGARSAGKASVDYLSFFYPLDGIKHWNRAYGPRGFYQHQALIPAAVAREGLQALVAAVRASGERSAVSVLKTTGARKLPGLLSYPIEGVTLALDFANRGESTLRLLERLDAITVEFGGRVNPSKDATMSAETFAAGFGTDAIKRFEKLRDPGLGSLQSKRLLGK